MTDQQGSSRTSGQQNLNYNTPASVIASKVNDGGEFILITRAGQSTDPQVWSSGDPQQTQQMFKHLQSKVQVDSLVMGTGASTSLKCGLR